MVEMITRSSQTVTNCHALEFKTKMKNPFYTFIPDTQKPVNYNEWWEVFDALFPNGQHTKTDTKKATPEEYNIVVSKSKLLFPSYKITRSNFSLNIFFNIAGLDPKNIIISATPNDNVFVVKYCESSEPEGTTQELYRGNFDSSICDLHRIESEISNGILTVILHGTKPQLEEVINTTPTIKE
jgi:HSP20 family molecular chaperone IbpA